jgi:hypothetical protein
MDAYRTGQLDNLQQKLQQLQALMQQPSTPVPQAQPQKVISTVPIVDGLAGARQYLETLGPSCSAAVFDKEEAAFFLLSVDANGNKAPVKIGRFTLEDAPEPGSDNITKADLEAFRAEIRGMIAELARKEDAE